MDGYRYAGGICAVGGNLTIVLEGQNTVGSDGMEYGILVAGECTVTGDGAIDVSASDTAILANSITIDGSVSCLNASCDFFGALYTQVSDHIVIGGEYYYGVPAEITIEYGSVTNTYTPLTMVQANGQDLLNGGHVDGVSFDPETVTLTLKDAYITEPWGEDHEGITVYGDVTINLEGNNFVGGDKLEYGITVLGNCTVTGNGTLDAYGSNTAIYTYGSLAVDESIPELHASCGFTHGALWSGIHDIVIDGTPYVDEAAELTIQYGNVIDPDAHVHIYDQQVASDTYKVSGATCTEPAVYYKSCLCGESGIETFTYGEAAGHSWEQPVWKWSQDGKSCIAVFTCENDTSHVESLDANVTSSVKTPASCTEKGITAYTAAVEFNETAYTSVKELADIPVNEHDFKDGICTVCGAEDPDKAPADTDPEDTDPVQPGGTDPAPPDETNPVNPDENGPSNPEDTTPVPPEGSNPVQPDETTPTPVQPGNIASSAQTYDGNGSMAFWSVLMTASCLATAGAVIIAKKKSTK